MKFEDALQESLNAYGEDFQLKDKQIECLRILFEGKNDVIANLPTGYGKSVIFHLLPDLLARKAPLSSNNSPCVLVISPLNVIQDQLRRLEGKDSLSACRLDVSGHGYALVCTNEGDPEAPDMPEPTLEYSVDLRDVARGKYKIVNCHPEAIFCTSKGRAMIEDRDFQKCVVAVALDECHKVDQWAEKFRKAYKEIHTLKAFFPTIPYVALSATLTVKLKKSLPRTLGLENVKLVEASHDRPNIFLDVRKKTSSVRVTEAYENIFKPECEALASNPEDYPVTLMYLPIEWCAQASDYCEELFTRGGQPSVTLENNRYGVLFSKQDHEVVTAITGDLKNPEPRVRLVFCTSSVGMGFDAPKIQRVIHGRPPRNLSDYFQEVGRCGRDGQPAEGILYYNASDITANLPGIQDDIVTYCKDDKTCHREKILKNFGFRTREYSPRGCKCCSICKNICSCSSCLSDDMGV